MEKWKGSREEDEGEVRSIGDCRVQKTNITFTKNKLECDLSVGPTVIDLHLPKIRPGVIY